MLKTSELIQVNGSEKERGIAEDSIMYKRFNEVFSKFKRVALWGAGGRGKAVMEYIQEFGEEDKVIGFFDSDPKTWDKQIKGKIVYNPVQYQEISPNAVIITSHAEEAITNSLNKLSLPPHNIIRSSDFLNDEDNIDKKSNLFSRWRELPDIESAFANHLKYLANLTLSDEIIDNYPFYMVIEPTNRCNLRCFLCGGDNRVQKGANMGINVFREIIDELGKYLFFIHPFKGGDSLVNRDFIEMLRYAHEKTGAFIIFSSNFSFHLSDNQLKSILRYCDNIGICMDGMSPKSYQKYRVNGNFHLVFDNMRRLSDLSKKMNSPPELVWRYIVFNHNEHEIGQAAETAKALGVSIEFVKAQVMDRSWLPENKEFWRDEYLDYKSDAEEPKSGPMRTHPCNWLYGSAIINADRAMIPCCEFWPNWGVFGVYDTGCFMDVFNNNEYRVARTTVPLYKGLASGKCINCLPYMRSREANLDMWGGKIQEFMLREERCSFEDVVKKISNRQIRVLMESSSINEKLRNLISCYTN